MNMRMILWLLILECDNKRLWNLEFRWVDVFIKQCVICSVFMIENKMPISVLHNCKRASFWSPNPAQARHIILKPDLSPKAKFTEWVMICATAGINKRSVRVAAGRLHGFITPKIAITLTKTLTWTSTKLACKSMIIQRNVMFLKTN